MDVYDEQPVTVHFHQHGPRLETHDYWGFYSKASLCGKKIFQEEEEFSDEWKCAIIPGEEDYWPDESKTVCSACIEAFGRADWLLVSLKAATEVEPINR